ncbi:MAG: META domain-containing protein [Bacteroidales bacterium]|nr:META domain-containing protein [Bacteroidales bacterium]
MIALGAASCHSTKQSAKQSSGVATIDDAQKVTDKKWQLIELHGTAFSASVNVPYFVLRGGSQRIEGSGGCNTFTGEYEASGIGRIKFSKIAATQKACLKMETEDELFKILGMVDNYTLSADGKTLSLNRARMAPLARFESVN